MQDPIQNPLIQKIKTHLETLKPVQDLLDNNKYTPALTDKEKEAEQAELDGFATNQDRHYEHDTDKSEIRRKYTKINVERNIAKSKNIDRIQKLLEKTKAEIESLLLEIDAELNKELSMSDKIKGSLLSKSYNGEGNGIKSKIFKELNQNMFYSLYQPKLPNDIGLFKIWQEDLKGNGIEFSLNTTLKKLNSNKWIEEPTSPSLYRRIFTFRRLLLKLAD